ncbi:MAG: hypothetical protein U0234_10670 [Sandaracinus sp.]
MNPRTRDGGAGRDGAAPDTGAPDCDPPCSGTETCVAGVCRAATEDGDGDGVPASTDCDDANASIGTMSERSCSSSCGTGVERCTNGTWAACTAPASCDCTAGEPPRTIACMRCGMQQQICQDGVWTDSGLCTGGGPCSPGDMDTGGTCGMCGTQTRICQADCTWGAWACMDEGVCVAGMTDSGSQACGTCGNGTQTRSRSCDSASCQWGAWSAWSACIGGESGACSPGQTDMQTQACPGGCANQTRTRSCDTAAGCNWGAWSAWSACPSCGPVCGNSSCESGETCSSCAADCRYGHQGTGHGGDSCAGVPAETWRCVSGDSACGSGSVSQVCRNGHWLNFNCSPRNCGACFCAYSSNCAQ